MRLPPTSIRITVKSQKLLKPHCFIWFGAAKLARDYQATLEEYCGKAHLLSDLRKRFDNKNLSSKKQWQAFAEGYQELKTATKIQKYFYTAKFKKTLYKQVSDYIEESYPLFAKIKL